jgi:hypothetical protein
MRSNIGNHTTLLVVATCAILAVVAVGLTTALASPGTPSSTPAPARGSASAHLSDVARASFSVFGQPLGDGEDLRVVNEIVI